MRTSREQRAKSRAARGSKKEMRERNAGSYLYVALLRATSSWCAVMSTMDPKATPPSGSDLMASRSAALTLSRPSAFAAR